MKQRSYWDDPHPTELRKRGTVLPQGNAAARKQEIYGFFFSKISCVITRASGGSLKLVHTHAWNATGELARNAWGAHLQLRTGTTRLPPSPPAPQRQSSPVLRPYEPRGRRVPRACAPRVRRGGRAPAGLPIRVRIRSDERQRRVRSPAGTFWRQSLWLFCCLVPSSAQRSSCAEPSSGVPSRRPSLARAPRSRAPPRQVGSSPSSDLTRDSPRPKVREQGCSAREHHRYASAEASGARAAASCRCHVSAISAGESAGPCALRAVVVLHSIGSRCRCFRLALFEHLHVARTARGNCNAHGPYA